MVKPINRKDIMKYLPTIEQILKADVSFTGDVSVKGKECERFYRMGRNAIITAPLCSTTGIDLSKELIKNTESGINNYWTFYKMPEFVKSLGGQSGFEKDNLISWLRNLLEDTPYLKYFKTVTNGECHICTDSLKVCYFAMRNTNAPNDLLYPLYRLFLYYRIMEVSEDFEKLKKLRKVKENIRYSATATFSSIRLKGYMHDGFAYYATKDPKYNYYLLQPLCFQEQVYVAVANAVLGKATGNTMSEAIALTKKHPEGFIFKDLQIDMESRLLDSILTYMPRLSDGVGAKDYNKLALQVGKNFSLANANSTTASRTIYSAIVGLYTEAIMGIWLNELANDLSAVKYNIPDVDCNIVYANPRLAIVACDKTLPVTNVFGPNAQYMRLLEPADKQTTPLSISTLIHDII